MTDYGALIIIALLILNLVYQIFSEIRFKEQMDRIEEELDIMENKTHYVNLY